MATLSFNTEYFTNAGTGIVNDGDLSLKKNKRRRHRDLILLLVANFATAQKCCNSLLTVTLLQAEEWLLASLTLNMHIYKQCYIYQHKALLIGKSFPKGMLQIHVYAHKNNRRLLSEVVLMSFLDHIIKILFF